MVWRSGVQRCCPGPELRVSGRALLVLAFMLLAGDARWTLSALISGTVHELGHLAALRLMGCSVSRIEAEAWGAVITTGPLSPWEELICAAAGPCAGLMLCFAGNALPRIGFCALMQSVFNLLPVYPLDGGRVLLALRNICCKERDFGVQ